MHDEIAPSIPYAIDPEQKRDYANKVIERFCNPFIDHQWLSITLQYTSKMKMRNVPLLLRHYEWNDTAPVFMATGFAGYLLFMKATKKEGDRYFGQRDGIDYEIKDGSAEYFHELWRNNDSDQVVDKVLSDTGSLGG